MFNSEHTFEKKFTPIKNFDFINCSSAILKENFLTTRERHAIIEKKYFALWKLFILYRKKKKYISEKEQLYDNKIATFLVNINKKSSTKTALVIKNTNLEIDRSMVLPKTVKVSFGEVYKNRFDALRGVIENQKSVIAEKDNIIKQLKNNNISFVTNVGPKNEIFNDSEPPLTKVLKKTLDHPLVKKMMEREEERKNRWLLCEMRKKEKEAFLARMLQIEQEEAKQLEMEQKKNKFKEKKEMERLKKQIELEKKKEQEFCIALRSKVEKWDKKILCAKIYNQWYNHMRYLNDLQIYLTEQFENRLLYKTLNCWKNKVAWKQNYLYNLSIKFDKNYLLISTLWQWKKKIIDLKNQKYALNQFLDKEMSRKVCRTWLHFTHKSVYKQEILFKSTLLIYDRLILIKSLYLWKKLPYILFKEREKEKRLREWESKVKSILPDYCVDSF